MDVIGCLEYDPDLQTPQQHRQFLSTAVVFKEVVPITSQDVLSKIHQTYRIQYLKDVILPRRWVGAQHTADLDSSRRLAACSGSQRGGVCVAASGAQACLCDNMRSTIRLEAHVVHKLWPGSLLHYPCSTTAGSSTC